MDAKTDDKSAGKCPFTGARGHANRDWWPDALDIEMLHRELQPVRSDGQGFRLRQGVQEPRPQRRDQGPACLDDGFAGVVAGRLRPLRRPDDPHGVAQRGHLPHHRRPRRRRRRTAALRAAQLLAGQRQPRQGAPAAVADQAEIRPENFLGRPDDPRRQRRARVDGLQDVRFRRRPRRCLGAGRALLGSRRHVARRRALQRRAPARRAARRGADGPDLRQSGRAERQSGPDRGGQGHPRDVLPHGDERRGDRRADRRRPHLRQDPRRRRSVAGRTGPGKRRARGSGPRLEEQARHRLRRRRHHRRSGSHLDADADEVEQPLLQEPVRKRMGADEEPGRREAVEGERCASHASRTPSTSRRSMCRPC